MFRKLYLKNFKVWGEQLWDDGVELAPVTLLLGTNSSGKTSLLQSLLLLKQTFQSSDPNLDLNLGGQPGDIADFGVYKDIAHGHSVKTELGFGVSVVHRRPTSRMAIDYRATFISKGGVPVTSRLSMHRQSEPSFRRGTEMFSLTRHSTRGYAVSSSINEKEGDGASSPKVFASEPSKRFRPQKSLFFSWPAMSALREERADVESVSQAILNKFRKTYYLGPLRDYPKRTYLWSRQRPGEIGSRGEQAVAALLASAKAPMSSPHRDGAHDEPSVVAQVSRWLQRVGVADSLEVKRQGQSRFYDVVINRDGRSASLVDVGFGVSQVLPMIVLAYFVPHGSTIVAEQPEIHLHPLAQSALSDLMVEVARDRGVQFIIETHSEHMFRRLQTLIAENAIPAEYSRLYFAKRDDGGNAILEQLRTDPYGRIENWPKNFFGDAIGETERQVRQMVERMKKERGGEEDA